MMEKKEESQNSSNVSKQASDAQDKLLIVKEAKSDVVSQKSGSSHEN